VWHHVHAARNAPDIRSESVYGSFFEYSDLKQNQKNQITESFVGFSDLVWKRKKGKRNKPVSGFLNPKQKNKNR
jgi:hypothetical protein